MRKHILSIYPLLATGLVLLGLWIADRFITPPWREELNQYLSAKTNPPTALAIFTRAVQASYPWQFQAAVMGAASYGDCYFFNVTYCYHTNQKLPSELVFQLQLPVS